MVSSGAKLVEKIYVEIDTTHILVGKFEGLKVGNSLKDFTTC